MFEALNLNPEKRDLGIMNPMFYSAPQLLCRANDNDSLVPEVWAREALAVLESNMVMGSLVYRDYNDMIANFGDVVNTRRPVDFKAKRKVDGDALETQDAQSPNIRVPLDQWLTVSFILYDGEMTKSMSDLISLYLQPAAKELAEQVDRTLAGQAARLSANVAGRLGEMSKTNASDFVLEADEVLNTNRAPKQGRNLVLSPKSNSYCLANELFVSAEKRGDEGTALRAASLGSVYGFDSYMDQNVVHVRIYSADVSTGLTDGAEAAGATVIETTVTYTDVVAGDYVVFEGEGYPHRVASVADTGGDADITLVEGLRVAVGSGADVTVYKAANAEDTGSDVAPAAVYPAGWHKRILIEGYTSGKHPQVGQWLTFGTGVSSHTYTITQVDVVSATTSHVTLDRPLDVALTTDQVCFPGPAGSFNLAFTRNAIAMVNRPLNAPLAGTGARSFVASYNGLSCRVTISYDGSVQGHRVTLDLLMGVAILQEDEAVVLLG